MGAHVGVSDMCLELCAFEISWGVGQEWLRAVGLSVMVGV